jgi:hypothetical protein
VTKSDDVRCGEFGTSSIFEAAFSSLRRCFSVLLKDLFDHYELQTILNHEDCAVALHQRPAVWRGILARLPRALNNDQLRDIACELRGSTEETLAALTTQMATLQDCLKARQPTAQLLTRIVAVADQAFQQIHLSPLFYSPFLEDEEEFSCATHRYAEALVKVRNVHGALLRRSTEGPTLVSHRAVLGLFRDSLSLLDGYADRLDEHVCRRLDTSVVTVQVREYGSGIPSGLLEEVDFRPNGDGRGAGVRGMGEQVSDFFEPLEVVCGNTVLVLASYARR